MSLAEFQRAFADLISSPPLVLAARANPDAVLGDYHLDARERRRLIAMLGDAGMSINCTLFRVNRLTPLYSVLPLTCAWLGASLSTELDAFWAASRNASLQYGPEAWRFGRWIQARIEAGSLSPGPVEDALRFELAAFEVRTAATEGPPELYPHPRKRLLRFRYPADIVLDPRADASSRAPSPRGEWLLLDATGETLEVYRLDDGAGEALAALD